MHTHTHTQKKVLLLTLTHIFPQAHPHTHTNKTYTSPKTPSQTERHTDTHKADNSILKYFNNPSKKNLTNCLPYRHVHTVATAPPTLPLPPRFARPGSYQRRAATALPSGSLGRAHTHTHTHPSKVSAEPICQMKARSLQRPPPRGSPHFHWVSL